MVLILANDNNFIILDKIRLLSWHLQDFSNHLICLNSAPASSRPSLNSQSATDA